MRYILLLFIILGCLVACDSQVSDSSKTTVDQNGGYTIEQTETVVDLYISDCASCHGNDLRGTEGGTSLVGSGFLNKWMDKSVGDLFRYTKTTMPQSNPGAYDDETYAALLAYILKINKYVPGSTPLSSIQSDLDKITLSELPEMKQ